VAKAFKVFIGDLLFKFLADALILGSPGYTARAITAFLLQALFYACHDLLIGVKFYCHIDSLSFIIFKKTPADAGVFSYFLG